MDAKNIEKLVQKAKDDILTEVNDRLPRKVGVIAVNHFKQNFRDGGWLDAGLHPWKKTKRQQQKGTDAKYGPLTSRRNHLMSSIQSKISKSSCQISRSLMKTMVSSKISTKKMRICILSRFLQFSSISKRLHGSGTMEAIKVFPLFAP